MGAQAVRSNKRSTPRSRHIYRSACALPGGQARIDGYSCVDDGESQGGFDQDVQPDCRRDSGALFTPGPKSPLGTRESIIAE